MTTDTHTPIPTAPIQASGAGDLDGFESVCSCGLVMRNTVRSNVDLDVREHLAYFAAKEALR